MVSNENLKNLIPCRIKIFAWFPLLGKLNTREKLSKLGILSSTEVSCAFCKDHIESGDHLSIQCVFASRNLVLVVLDLGHELDLTFFSEGSFP